jgi:hypothetical protein
MSSRTPGIDEPDAPCKCGHIACVCDIIAVHRPKCPFRLSATCPVGIECKHGRDTCPKCDPCTCRTPEARANRRRYR